MSTYEASVAGAAAKDRRVKGDLYPFAWMNRSPRVRQRLRDLALADVDPGAIGCLRAPFMITETSRLRGGEFPPHG
jgi:hypothetical protein